MRSVICAAVVLAAVTTGARAEATYDIAWQRQIGTDMADESHSVAVDASGNLYLTGSTSSIRA